MKKYIKKKFRQIKKFPSWFYFFPAFFLRLCRATMRVTIYDPHKNSDPERFPFICLIWHNRQLFFPLLFPRRLRRLCVAVVSSSRDGQYVVDLLEQFDVGSIRGSSSKRGAAVLHEAIKTLKEKKNVCFTPDGPRGPIYKLSKGPVYLSSVTGAPIIPIGINASSYWEIKSWDKFQIFKPFCKVEVILDEPISVPPGIGDEELETWRKKIEDRMNKINNPEA